MHCQEAQNQNEWDTFLCRQTFSPFLQSWTMGDVYKDTNQTPIRLEVRDDSNQIVGICQAIVVPARRGKHLSVPYGPVIINSQFSILNSDEIIKTLIDTLKEVAKAHNCSFIRTSPFWPEKSELEQPLTKEIKTLPSPLHLLGEHVWYIPLIHSHPWTECHTEHSRSMTRPKVPLDEACFEQSRRARSDTKRTKEEILAAMRKNHRDLIRRAEKEGVTITRSQRPLNDLHHFLKLHEETRKRHQFTPYTDAFFKAQVEHFSKRDECTLYLANYNGEVIASSVHMHMGGETSYHHGASTQKYSKVPSSYLLQWTTICDALERNDHTYSFWGIAPIEITEDGKHNILNPKHPFAGVTTFKTGFGGELLNLMHCKDIPLSSKYYITRAFEQLRKWKRGF